MATEQDERPGNAILHASDGAAHQKFHRKTPWSWKIDTASFVLSLIALCAVLGLLAAFDDTFRGYYFWPSSHWLRFGVGCLLFAIYFFLLIPLSNSLYRIGQIHSSYPTWVFSSNGTSAKLKQPFQATHTLFTSSVLGIAPVPTIVLLVVAAVVVAPWTIALVEYRRSFRPTPERLLRFSQAKIPIAQRLDVDISKDWPSYTRPQDTIHAAVWKGFAGAAPDTTVYCIGYGGYTGVSCSWEGYATLQVRVQCGSIDQDLELSSSHSIFQAMHDVDSIPPYNPHHESRANHSSPSILSLKGNTFVTLSNLMDYTGPWRDDADARNVESEKGKRRQIKKEALKKLRRFSSLVINPVDSQQLKNPLYNQTAGGLGNFHIIKAELGIDGHYDKNGKLDWIEVERGDTAAWECTIDTVVQAKTASQNGDILSEINNWGSQPVLPTTMELSNRTCLENPDSCSGPNRQDISYTWNDKQFTIDRRITEAISYELEQVFLGSGFAQGWRSKTEKALPVLQTSSQSALLIFHQIQSTSFWYVMSAFGTLDSILTWWMRRYYSGYCIYHPQSDREEICRESEFVGKTEEQIDYYHVNWVYLAYPLALIAVTLLVMIAAALDERFSRIRLGGDNDPAADDGENDVLLGAASARARESDRAEPATVPSRD